MATMFERGRNMIARVLPEVWVNEVFNLYLRGPGDTWGAANECNGKRGSFTKSDARIASGQVEAGTLVFLLEAADLSVVPRPHDKIVGADDIEYFIGEKGVELINFDGSFWRCQMVKEQ